ncbi:Hypothetical predicted protein [Pelobates cultripes]|uniref:Uncharacterized protein n=1 Tax=Pelobates cultripes TaxID=61616 RepID=A0AAD1WC03_PELCU|nr:Hypothetical predicted protein [Pelobates cultripes]
MANKQHPAEPTLLPTSSGLSFSIEHSLERLEETVVQHTEPRDVNKPPLDKEGKQAPVNTPLYSPGPKATQGGPLLHSKSEGLDPYVPHAREIEAPTATRAQLWMDILTLRYLSGPPVKPTPDR